MLLYMIFLLHIYMKCLKSLQKELRRTGKIDPSLLEDASPRAGSRKAGFVANTIFYDFYNNL